MAVDLVAVDQDVAGVDADPEGDPAASLDRPVADLDPLLDFERAGERCLRSGKLGEDAVTDQPDDPPAVGKDRRLDDLVQMSLDPGVGVQLVLAHEPAVVDHVGRENRRLAALDALIDDGRGRRHRASRDRSP